MAVTFGNTGAIDLGAGAGEIGPVAEVHVFEWVLNITQPVDDSSEFTTNANQRTHELGLYSATGTARGFLPVTSFGVAQDAAFNANRASVSCTFTTNDPGLTNQIVSGNFHIISTNLRVNKQTGLSEISVELLSDGDLTFTNGVV